MKYNDIIIDTKSRSTQFHPIRFYSALQSCGTVIYNAKLNTFLKLIINAGLEIPPIVVVVFQKASRSRGSFTESIHKFEMPGGYLEGGQPNLDSLSFTINNNEFLGKIKN